MKDCLRSTSLPFRFLPLHSVWCTGTLRIILWDLRTNDHVTWTPFICQGEMCSKDTGPTAKVLLLAGLLRGPSETNPEVDVRNLDIYLPDQSLFTSSRFPPESFSNEVAECLYKNLPIYISPRSDEFASLPRLLRFTRTIGTGDGHGVSLCLSDLGCHLAEFCSTTYGS